MPYDRIIFRVHAVQRMFENRVSEIDVRDILEHGESIEEYREDAPLIKRIMLGHPGSRPIHIVTEDDPEAEVTSIITVYEPDPQRWESGFRMRKRP